jgi:hypothetical protein
MRRVKSKSFIGIYLGLIFITYLFSLPVYSQVKSEVEPNDAREQAQEIRVGDSIEGGFQKDSEYDWYKLTVDKTGKNYLQVDISAVPGIDTYLYFYDANGKDLTDVNDADENGAESIFRFPVEPGIYYVRVYGRGKATNEKYTLSTRLTGPWQEGQETEPNDSREAGNELKLGQSVEGYFERKGDEDWYKLTDDKPGKTLVQIDVSAVPGVDVVIELRDQKSQIWRTNETDKNGPESIFNLAFDQGVYYVNVWAREANIKDKYILSTKILGTWQEGMEAEPNNERDRATDLRLGQAVEGYFQNEGDEDYYRLIVDKPGKNLIQVDLSAVPGVDERFQILDKDGKKLWNADDGSKGEPE